MSTIIDLPAAEAACKRLDELRAQKEGPDYLIKKLNALLAEKERTDPEFRAVREARRKAARR